MNLLITDPKHISYITGADFEGFWLFICDTKVYAITSEMIKGQLLQLTENKNFSYLHLNKNFKKMKIITAKKFFADEIINICKKNNIKEVCIDGFNISYLLFNFLETKFKENKISIKADNKIIIEKRKIKDTAEIKNIKKACDTVCEVFNTVKKKIVCGMTELDIHFEIEKEFAAHHVVQSFKTIVASGPNCANPHHISGKRKIQKNDIILIDMGCIYNGYCSDLTRTFFIGTAKKEQLKIYNIVNAAHDKALENVKANMKARDIDLFARNVIKKAGYGKNFIHTTGHGVGLEIHEAPAVGKNSKEILNKNMVITIEPGIYLPKKFGVRTEDTVLVTENGYEVLTEKAEKAIYNL